MQTPVQIERNIRLSGGKAVVKGAQTTYGHVGKVPQEAFDDERLGSRVLSADLFAQIANGILTGISAENGINDAVSVDDSFYGQAPNMVSCVIVGIRESRNEPHGEMLDLFLKRA